MKIYDVSIVENATKEQAAKALFPNIARWATIFNALPTADLGSVVDHGHGEERLEGVYLWRSKAMLWRLLYSLAYITGDAALDHTTPPYTLNVTWMMNKISFYF